MSVAAETEREFKFDVATDFETPDLRPVVGRTERLPEVEHRTVYLDTADHRLWDRGITLRHRSTGGGSGDGGAAGGGKWTLKLPVDGRRPDSTGPGELSERSELTWVGERGQVPEPVRRILAGVVRRAPLVEVAELSAMRQRLLLHAADGTGAWGEVDDDLVSVTAGPGAGRRFRQIEIELAAGQDPPAGVLEAVLDRMRGAGASPGGASKLAAALAPDEPGGGAPGGAARKGGAGGKGGATPKSRRRVTVAAATSEILAADLDAVLACDVRLRRAVEAGEEPGVDAVHRARVAFRRMRAHVRTLGPVLDPVWAGHVRRDLETVGRSLGRVRDADVLLDRLRAHDDLGDADGLEELVHLVSADRALAAAELVPLLTASMYSDMLDRVASAAVAPPLYSPLDPSPGGRAAGPVMHDLVSRRWKRTKAEIGGLVARPGPGDLHQVRIRAKRLRYAAEAAAPYAGRDARRAGKRAKALQQVLGEVHDSATAVSWLRQLGSHPSVTPTAAFVAGRLAGQAEVSARLLGGDWRRAARRMKAKRLRAAFG